MVAYSFERRHHDNILSGAKPFTMRATGRKRHVRLRETIQMRDGRTGPVFATAVCVFRANVGFNSDGVTRVLDAEWTGAGEKISRAFSAAENASPQAAEHREKIAQLDGFTSYDDMVRWHAEQEPKGSLESGQIIWREVIGFAEVRPTADAAPAQDPHTGDYKPDVCIYHGNCADGFTAAWAVFKRWPDCVFVEGRYGIIEPDLFVTLAGKHVLIVDFSYKRPVLEALGSEAASITILDHHKSAQLDLEAFAILNPVDYRSIEPMLAMTQPGLGNIRAEFDMNRSGAMMAWNFAHPGEEPPRLVQHVQDRDLWRFALPNTREIQAVVFSYEYDFEVWDSLARQIDQEEGRAAIIAQGAAIERKHFKDVEELLGVTCRSMVIGGHKVPVANLPYTMASDAANILAEGSPFAACYFDNDKGERVFSLRSRDEPYAADVSVIAASYGGGGHARAAGFTAPKGWEGEA